MSLRLTSLAVLTLATGSLVANEPESIVQGNKGTVAGILQNGSKVVDKAAEKSAEIMSERGSDHRNWVVSRGKTKVKYLYRERKTGDAEEATGKQKWVKFEFYGGKEPGVVVLNWKLAPGSYNITFSEGNINKVWIHLMDKEGKDIDEDGNTGKVGFKTWPIFTLKIPINTEGNVLLFLQPDSHILAHDPDFKSKLFFDDLIVAPIAE